MTGRWIKSVYRILNVDPDSKGAARILNAFIMTLIALNVLAVILDTVRSMDERYHDLFRLFEIFSVMVFTLEYTLRLWSCTESEKFRHPVKGRLGYMVSPMALVDLAAILPFYLPMVLMLDLRFVRAIRLMRLFRLFKMGRYSQSLKMIINVFRAKKPELMISLAVLSILLIFASSLMYYCEHEAQPDNFSSIPAAMWWGVSTLTTVGYGDIYPVTHIGRFMGAIISILGIGIFALPAGILASGMIDEMHKEKEPSVCPHCGKPL